MMYLCVVADAKNPNEEATSAKGWVKCRGSRRRKGNSGIADTAVVALLSYNNAREDG